MPPPMSPPKKKSETLEHHVGHTADEIKEIARRLNDIERRIASLEDAASQARPTSDVGLDGRVKALEEWRHALRKHTHQFLHDSGWKEPQ